MAEKVIMLGNEAIARGAYEAGVKVSSAYPGTPSTEISEYLVQYRDDVYEEWAPNEKVATEVAVGASLAGVRSMACMKHVGLNVAADPLYSVSYMGVNGGLVIVVADDPGLYSSQNEQDTRMVARAAQIPVIEPSDSAEAKDFFKAAFELSEKFDRPFIFRVIDTTMCMGSSISTLHGMEKAKGKEYIKDWVAVIGDSTFMHTGVNSLMNMVYNKATGTVIILDNSTTGMTGHQDHAATGKTLQGDPTYAISIPGICRAMGIKNVYEINAFDIALLEKTIKEETAKDEISVIITKTPCVLLDKRKKPLYTAHEDKCKKCGMCMKPGCPAMTKNEDGTIHIDDTMCTGCGLCETLCKFDAIELVKAGE